MQEIGNFAFEYTLLSAVDLPQELTTIGDSAFAHCDGLSRLFLPDSLTAIGENAFDSTLPLYCRDGSYAAAYIEEHGLTRGYYGDVNEDGAPDSRDARLLLQYTVDAVDFTEVEQRIADITADGILDSADARAVLQAAVA